MRPAVATLDLIGRRTGKPDLEIRARIEAPYALENGDWACPVSLVPLYSRLPDIQGVSSFQSLGLAISLVTALLEAFEEDGGQLFFQGEETSLVADFFGAKRP